MKANLIFFCGTGIAIQMKIEWLQHFWMRHTNYNNKSEMKSGTRWGQRWGSEEEANTTENKKRGGKKAKENGKKNYAIKINICVRIWCEGTIFFER